MKTGHA